MTTPANATMEGQYSFIEDLVSSVPELAQLLKNASAQGATADTFQAMLEASNWWRTNASTARQQIALQASDPASYQQGINQAQAHVKAMAAQMGVPLTDAQVSQFATTDLYQGLNDDQLKANLGGALGTSTTPSTGATGDVADYTQQLQALAASYGVPVTSTWINSQIQTALSTGMSAQEMIAGARTTMINSATTAYPPLAQQLAAGQTVHDIAQPYIASMSQILEIPDSDIDVTDPTIQKALSNPSLVAGASAPKASASSSAGGNGMPAGWTATQGTSTAGTTSQPGSTTMPLWQFQNQLRADPRWQQTDNAKQSAYSMAASLGKQWGFAS